MTQSDHRLARRVILLGSTGSIGVNTLAVIEHLRAQNLADFEIIGIATGRNIDLATEQARIFNVPHIAIAQKTSTQSVSSSRHVYNGENAALDMVRSVAQKGDLVIGAMVGSAGVPATLAAIEIGCDIALANKETLVAAGALVMPKVAEKGVMLLPIDSEHSAIFQCLSEKASGNPNQVRPEAFLKPETSSVRRIVITASGGPFRAWDKTQTENATVEQALNHPTWNMGPKVTIDSATLMNKALEIIEAHWLFDLPASKIDVLVHPQSLIHSFVEFVDGSVLAQLGPPDMRTPIQYALTWPLRLPGCSKRLDWTKLRQMDFEPVDQNRFAAPRLARQVIESGGTAGAIFNAANETAVTAFLDRRIAFGQISKLVEEALETVDSVPVRTLDDVMAADQEARRFVNNAMTARTDARQTTPC